MASWTLLTLWLALTASSECSTITHVTMTTASSRLRSSGGAGATISTETSSTSDHIPIPGLSMMPETSLSQNSVSPTSRGTNSSHESTAGLTESSPVTQSGSFVHQVSTEPRHSTATSTVKMAVTNDTQIQPTAHGSSGNLTVSSAYGTNSATVPPSSYTQTNAAAVTKVTGSASRTLTPQTSFTAETTGGAPAVAAVPGWGIALLVLASLVLLLLILLLIGLLLWCCCRGRHKAFSPYENLDHKGDIPLYTTHGRFEGRNGTPYEVIN